MTIINCDKTDCRVCNFHHCGLHDYNKAVTEYSRPKGRWRRDFSGNEWYWYCSLCKEEYFEEELYMGGNTFPNFCPNCGAEMRTEEMESEE